MKKKSLNAKLYDMKQYEVSGKDIFGGTYFETETATHKGDNFTSELERHNTNWDDDVTPNKIVVQCGNNNNNNNTNSRSQVGNIIYDPNRVISLQYPESNYLG